MAETVAERLDAAMDRGGWSALELHRRVKKHHPDVRGLSYTSIRNYRNGKSIPRADVLQILADELQLPAGELTGELERQVDSDSQMSVHIGSPYVLAHAHNRLLITGEEDDPFLRTIADIMEGIEASAGHVPLAGRDIIFRFLLDLDHSGGHSEVRNTEHVNRLVQKFFPPVDMEGDYATRVAAVLAQAQLAYLTFGRAVNPGAILL